MSVNQSSRNYGSSSGIIAVRVPVVLAALFCIFAVMWVRQVDPSKVSAKAVPLSRPAHSERVIHRSQKMLGTEKLASLEVLSSAMELSLLDVETEIDREFMLKASAVNVMVFSARNQHPLGLIQCTAKRQTPDQVQSRRGYFCSFHPDAMDI